jgi:hypothetical protein
VSAPIWIILVVVALLVGVVLLIRGERETEIEDPEIDVDSITADEADDDEEVTL